MSHYLLSLNQSKRQTVSLFMIICFAMFNAWQMGFIFFMNPSLSVTGRSPLPISMDNVTTIMALGYVIAITYMIFLPRFVIWAERISTLIALITIGMMFLNLNNEIMLMVIYLHIFCCCFMIGFESFIIMNFFTEKSVITYLTLGYAIATALIALIQNELIPLSFSSFRIAVVIFLLMLLTFAFKMPSNEEYCPTYVTKNDKLVMPKNLFTGIIAISFVSCLMMLCGPAAVGDIAHGISLAYFSNAISSILMYLVYRKSDFHPLHIVSLFMTISALGYLALYLSIYAPILKYLACILIGFGFTPCQLLPLYGMTLMKSYPSKYICPSIILIGVITVVIQSVIAELFGTNPHMLLLIYMAMMVILTLVYNQWEPYLVHSLLRKIHVEESDTKPNKNVPINDETFNSLSTLTKREREVLEFIGCGYSNSDIAKILLISDHTVNDYTKKIYRKLNVHSRHAAARIINQYENS